MVNYSQWHTERSSNKEVHEIEKINVLSGKMDELVKLFDTKSVSSVAHPQSNGQSIGFRVLADP